MFEAAGGGADGVVARVGRATAGGFHAHADLPCPRDLDGVA
ncbi:MAG: hypothetical protein ACOYOU_09725 [Kiritimatiellia bacterium]